MGRILKQVQSKGIGYKVHSSKIMNRNSRSLNFYVLLVLQDY